MSLPEVHFDIQTVAKGHHKATYRGIKCIKFPFDYMLHQMLIDRVKPDLIIEIGTNAGGSSLYYADLMRLYGGGKVHTMDITNMVQDERVLNDPDIVRFLGGYQSYDLENCKGFERILVIDDGSHHYHDVFAALQKFGPVVTKGSYFIVEDGILSHDGLGPEYGGGPLRAIEEYVPTSDFEIDREWCDFFGTNATVSVNGFLRKVR